MLSIPRNEDTLKKEIFDMRQRLRSELLEQKTGKFNLKQSPGGIVDIEFLVQHLVLLNAHQYPELLDWTDVVRILQTLLSSGNIDEYTANILRYAYLVYRSIAHKHSLQEKAPVISDHRFRELRSRVIQIWQKIMGEPITS